MRLLEFIPYLMVQLSPSAIPQRGLSLEPDRPNFVSLQKQLLFFSFFSPNIVFFFCNLAIRFQLRAITPRSLDSTSCCANEVL